MRLNVRAAGPPDGIGRDFRTFRAAVISMIETNREEMDGLSARTVALRADIKAMQDAQANFKFARETPNDSEVLDMPACLPAPTRSVNGPDEMPGPTGEDRTGSRRPSA